MMEIIGVILIAITTSGGLLIYIIAVKMRRQFMEVPDDDKKENSSMFLTYRQANIEFVRKEMFDMALNQIHCDISDTKIISQNTQRMVQDMMGALAKHGFMQRKDDGGE